MSCKCAIRILYSSFCFLLALLLNSGRCHGQAQSPAPLPNLALSVNGKPVPQTIQGEALVFSAVLYHPEIFGQNVTPLQINPEAGSWANTVRIAVTDSKGAAVAWPIHPAGSSLGGLSLDAEQTGVLYWVLDASDSRNLAPGAYQIFAILDTTSSAGATGWSGTTSSDVVSLQMTAPSQPSPAQVQQQLISQAVADHLSGNDGQAVADLNQMLTQFPNFVEALALKGQMLTNLGRLPEALQSFEQALAALDAQATSTPQEPPSGLLSAIAALRRSIYGGPGGSGGSAFSTTTVASVPELTYSPTSQSVTLIGKVSSASDIVNGGTISFTVAGLGAPITSPPTSQGVASASFPVPGGTHAGVYPVQATYNGTDLFAGSSDSSESLTIGKATPTIMWNNPGSIPSGTPLGPSQLNSSASVPGTFVYNPPAGMVLPSGTTQTLSVTFTPADSTDYNSATASVSVTILGGTYSGSVSPTSATIPVGSSQTFNIAVNSSTFDGPISLSCANAPAGITCQFQPSQFNLSPNGSASTTLKVTVTGKPAIVLLQPPAGPFDRILSPRFIVIFVTVAILILVLCATASDLRRYGCDHRGAVLGWVPLALLLFASLHLAACVSASLTGQSPSKNGGGGSAAPANVILTIQGNSGGNAVNITTLTITVP